MTMSSAASISDAQVLHFLHPRKVDAEPAANDALAPNAADIDQFIRSLAKPFAQFKDCTFEIRALDPHEKSGPINRSFAFTDDGISEAIEFAVDQNKGRRNIYIGLNPRRGSGTKDEDVVAAAFNFTDIDSGGNAVDRLLAMEPKPSFIIRTGTKPHERAWGFWMLEDAEHNLQTWKRRQEAFARALGSDPTVSNPSRIVRVAGTVSYPSQRKVAKGYVPELTTLRVVEEAPRSTPAEDLTAALRRMPAYQRDDRSEPGTAAIPLAATSSDAWYNQVDIGPQRPPLGELLHRLITNTGHEKYWGASACSVVKQLSEQGWSDRDILSLAEIITNPGYTVEETRKELAGMLRRWHEKQANSASAPQLSDAEASNLLSATSAQAWMNRDLPQAEPLLGDVITAGVRMFVVGRTGLGKTLLGMAMAFALATGTELLGWQATQSRRVLYIDGEMPAELLKQRMADAARRTGGEIPNGLFFISSELADEIANLIPSLPPWKPLNTPEGLAYLQAVVGLVKPDVVFLDNVMSLLAGGQKDEVTWSAALPTVTWMSQQKIAQVWLDHTGWNSDRQYGSNTKQWRFDCVLNMTPLDGQQLEDVSPGETGFNLSFDAPAGKARRRTPQNYAQFEPCVVKLAQGEWTRNSTATVDKSKPKLRPSEQLFYSALQDACVAAGAAGKTTEGAWVAECIRRGLLEAPEPGDDCRERNRKSGQFRTAKMNLLKAGVIGCDGKTVMLVHP
jgi:hypothetical protein